MQESRRGSAHALNGKERTETEIAEQNKIIENMVNLGVDGIALAPLNQKAMRKQVEAAVAAGIPCDLRLRCGWQAHSNFVAPTTRMAVYWRKGIDPPGG